jgi:hypothetical protein
MGECRNQLMKDGKPYPRSGCDICGSMFGPGKRMCLKGVTPDDPADAKYYVPTSLENPEEARFKYAVVYDETISHAGDERSRTNPGHGYPAWTETVAKIEMFESLDKLKAWVEKNNSGYSRKIFQAIKYQELKVSTEVVINVG